MLFMHILMRPPAASPALLLSGRSPGLQVLICRLPIRSPFTHIFWGVLTVAFLANPHSLTVAGAAQAWRTKVRAPVSRLTRLRGRREPQSGLNFTTNISWITKSNEAVKLQTACTNTPYHLTYQHFSNYSRYMENELNALEAKLAQLIQVSGKLRSENHQLRQELAHALSSNRQYSDKIEIATARLNKLLITLPEDQK